MTDDCLFCSIVAGTVPSSRVLDTEHVYVFRDIAPHAPVHLLVVPKQHIVDATTVTDGDGPILVAMLQAAKEAAEAEGIGSSGYRLIFNVGADAGQTIFHLHLHVVGGAPLGSMGA